MPPCIAPPPSRRLAPPCTSVHPCTSLHPLTRRSSYSVEWRRAAARAPPPRSSEAPRGGHRSPTARESIPRGHSTLRYCGGRRSRRAASAHRVRRWWAWVASPRLRCTLVGTTRAARSQALRSAGAGQAADRERYATHLSLRAVTAVPSACRPHFFHSAESMIQHTVTVVVPHILAPFMSRQYLSRDFSFRDVT